MAKCRSIKNLESGRRTPKIENVAAKSMKFLNL